MDPRVGLVLGFTFIRCTETPPHGGGDAGEAGNGTAAHGGTVAACGGTTAAGHGGAQAAQGGSTSGEGGRADAGNGGQGGRAGGGNAGQGGLSGGENGGEGGVSVGGEGGVSVGGEGGVLVGGEGGVSVGGEGGVSVGGEGGVLVGGEGGVSVGGEGGAAELPCVFDLLPDVGFAQPAWTESTGCVPFPGQTCPNPPPPIIVNGQARFSGSGRPGGSAWSQSVSTNVRLPSDANTVVIGGVPSRPECPLPGAQASVGATINGATLPLSQLVSVVQWRGQEVTVSITFSQTSGSPCFATVSDVSLTVQRCAQ